MLPYAAPVNNTSGEVRTPTAQSFSHSIPFCSSTARTAAASRRTQPCACHARANSQPCTPSACLCWATCYEHKPHCQWYWECWKETCAWCASLRAFLCQRSIQQEACALQVAGTPELHKAQAPAARSRCEQRQRQQAASPVGQRHQQQHQPGGGNSRRPCRGDGQAIRQPNVQAHPLA